MRLWRTRKENIQIRYFEEHQYTEMTQTERQEVEKEKFKNLGDL